MRILLVSDTESRFIWEFFDANVFKDVEAIISCGDLKRDYLEFLVTMIPAPLFFVPGNHDKTFEKNPPEGCTSLHNSVVKFKGLRICGLGGCKSPAIDRAYEYSEKQMSKMAYKLLKKAGKTVDILVTHAPALGLGDGDDLFHQGFESYLTLLERLSPKLYVFGHQHKVYKYNINTPEYYNNTRLINAYGYKIIDF